MDYQSIYEQAIQSACDAETAFMAQYGEPMYCGFAWVDIYGIKGNTKLGKTLKAAGIERSDYKKCFSIWNPSEHGAQNIDTKEAGAIAAAKVFEKYGFRAYAGSRLD